MQKHKLSTAEKLKLQFLIDVLMQNTSEGIHRFVALRLGETLIDVRYDRMDFPDGAEDILDRIGSVVVIYEEPSPLLADDPDHLKNLPFYPDYMNAPPDILRIISSSLEEIVGTFLV